MDACREKICAVATDVWAHTLDAVVGPVADGPPPDAADLVSGWVHITGAWEGTVGVQCATPLARRAAARMFDVPDAAASPADVQDAVGELTNMTGGNLKALLPEPCRLSLPVVVIGTDYATRLPRARVVERVRFDVDGSTLAITLWERDPTAEGPPRK